MGWVASALGVFYVLAALLVFRAMRMGGFASEAGGQLPRERASPTWLRLGAMTVSTCLYAMAGVALILNSAWAVWLLASGLLLQALYYGYAWRMTSAEAGEDGQARQSWSGAIISAAALAFSAYAARQGVLG